MRKTSAYARKQRRLGATYNGAEWANTIQRCRPYGTNDIVDGVLAGATQGAADKAAILVRSAYNAIKDGQAASNDSLEHDRIAHAIGVATIRAIQIAGEDESTNYALAILNKGTAAMRRVAARYHAIGRWGFDGPAIEEIGAAIEAYEVILQASSPAQMAIASDTRWEILKRQGALQ